MPIRNEKRCIQYLCICSLLHFNPRPTGGCLNTPPRVFFAIALHSCLDNCSASLLKILGPGHQRSDHQVSDPTSEKLYSRVTATWWLREIFETFKIWYNTKYLQLEYLDFFYIGDLRSGQFRDLPIISQWGKPKCLKYLSDLFNSFRTMLN